MYKKFTESYTTFRAIYKNFRNLQHKLHLSESGMRSGGFPIEPPTPREFSAAQSVQSAHHRAVIVPNNVESVLLRIQISAYT